MFYMEKAIPHLLTLLKPIEKNCYLKIDQLK